MNKLNIFNWVIGVISLIGVGALLGFFLKGLLYELNGDTGHACFYCLVALCSTQVSKELQLIIGTFASKEFADQMDRIQGGDK